MVDASDPNLVRLEEVAALLGPLLDELVLVGGTAAGLLITDPAAGLTRETFDVDVIVEAATYAEYGRLGVRVRDLGFSEGREPGDPLCRWRKAGLTLDLMPLSGDILGFSNRWYPAAFESAIESTLASGRTVRHVDGPHFLATKLEAFAGRGADDPVTSHDAEDVIRVVDGRPELADEIGASALELRASVASQLGAILADRHFVQAVPGYFDIDGELRSRIVLQRLRAIIELGSE